MSEIFATWTIIYCYFKTFELVGCAKVAVRHRFVISSLQKSVFYHVDERKKIFENIVNFAVEVLKKPGVEFLSFNWLRGE